MITARQNVLYNLLLTMGDVWTTQEDIANMMSDFYDGWGSEEFHNSNTRLAITKDIQALNLDDETEKVIISSPLGVKIATENECLYYISKEYASVFRKLARVRKKEKKARLNNQISINGKTIEAFLEEYFNG